MPKDYPIGIYDSGIGGLTVLSEVQRQLPHENIIYYGDTRHLPYGEKSPAEIINYNHHIFSVFAEQRCKMVIAACNTSSSLALDLMKKSYPGLPVIGLIRPGAEAAVSTSQNQRIGVIATSATVKSNAYLHAVQRINADTHVQQVACPEFVPMIEGGQLDTPEAYMIVNKYVSRFQDIDTIIYGCTHYPALQPILENIFPAQSVCFVNPAIATVRLAKSELSRLHIASDNTHHPDYTFLWSGHVPVQFNEKKYLAKREDTEDLLDLRQAKRKNAKQSSIPLKEVKKILDL